MEYTKDYLREHWSSGKKIMVQGKMYRVGRMSYGQYFFETGKERGETKGFNQGTKWLFKTKNPYLYKIDSFLSA